MWRGDSDQHRRLLEVRGLPQSQAKAHEADFYRGHGENVTHPTRRELREGGYTVQEFREVWGHINGAWDPDIEVIVYEFRLVSQSE